MSFFSTFRKWSKKTLSKLAFTVLVVGQLMPIGVVQAAPFSYTIQIVNYNVNGNVVDIDGTASGTPYVGQLGQHQVSVNWGDGTTSSTSTVNFIGAGSNFSGTWSNSHTYATADEYTITVKLYHAQQNGNDASDAQDVEIVEVRPVLTVIKNVINDDGGTKTSGDFTMNVTGTNVTDTSFPGDAAGTTVNLDAGSYSVDETADPNYTKTLSAECSGTIANGETKTCTITNDDNDVVVPVLPSLTVTKVVVNDNGGTAVVSDFPLFVDQTSVTSGVSNQFAVGAHAVSETSNASYITSFSGDCDGSGNVTLATGDNKTCTITNNDIAIVTPTKGTLTVTKVVTNDDGGTAVVSDFPLFIGQTSVTSGSTTSLDAGTYTVSETSNQNYTATFSGDCDANGSVNIEDGDTKSCTITNNDVPVVQPTTLTVIKQVINDDGGTQQVSDFPLFIDQTQVTSGDVNNVEPGTYTVSETSNASYIGSFLGDCDATGGVTLADGEAKTCTIINDDIGEDEPTEGTILVVKNVINDNNGTSVAGDFSLTITGNDFETTIPGDSQGTPVKVPAGSYSVTEQAAAGYTASYSQTCSGTVVAGQVIECDVTNDDNAPEPNDPILTVTKVVVNNNGGTLQVSDFPLHV